MIKECRIMLRENENPNDLRDNLLDEVVIPIHQNSKVTYYSCFDMHPKNFSILFKKAEIHISYPGLSQDKTRNKDQRILFSEIFLLGSIETLQIYVDFDKSHHENNEIHLNCKLKYGLENQSLSDLARRIKDKIDHQKIIFQKESRGISWFYTFVKLLKRIKLILLFGEFQIYQLDVSSEEYKLIEEILNDKRNKTLQ